MFSKTTILYYFCFLGLNKRQRQVTANDGIAKAYIILHHNLTAMDTITRARLRKME